MKKDFRKALSLEKCWDKEVDTINKEHHHPFIDSMLQNREEVILFCEWIEANNIQSYLEIGVWTGRLISSLHRIFKFNKLGACDILDPVKIFGLPISIPPETDFFIGDSHSEAYIQWRKDFGDVDLLFIDGEHTFESVLNDFRINSRFNQRYIAFHDILNDEVSRFWHQLKGEKMEIIKLNEETGFPSGMGIGIWKSEPFNQHFI